MPRWIKKKSLYAWDKGIRHPGAFVGCLVGLRTDGYHTGIDKITKEEYSEHSDVNPSSLLERLGKVSYIP